MKSDAALHSRRETSVSNTFVSISFPTYDAPDLEQFLINSKTDISGIISEELVQRKALKYYLSIRVELERLSVAGESETATPYIHSIPTIILESTDSNETYRIARLTGYLPYYPPSKAKGSGFSLLRLIECCINIATYDAVGGFVVHSATLLHRIEEVLYQCEEFRQFMFLIRGIILSKTSENKFK